jgi:general secretion pathway protein D
LFLSITCICAFAQAQNIPPMGGPAPLPGGPGGAAFQNPAVPPPQGMGGEAADVRLQFPQTDIAVILKFYEQLTGKQMVTDNSVAGSISIDISKMVTRDEAIRIIETSLYLNGFGLVPTEGNIVKVVGPGKNPRQFGINIYSDISQIPDNVSVVSVLFELSYTDSKDMKAIVDQYVSGSSAYQSVPPGSLIVTESTVMLRNIAKIIAAADVPPAEVESHFYKLQRANAKDVLDKLTKLFDKSAQGGQQQGGNTAPIPRMATAPNGQFLPPGSVQVPASLSGLSEDSIIVGKIKIDADERTNRIHVVTRPANLRFIEELIAQYDSDIQFGEPVKRPLKYVDAADVLDVIVKAITEPGTKSDDGPGFTTPPTNNNTQSANSTANGGADNSGGAGGDTGGGLSIQEGLETPQKDITPKAVTVGNTKIIADPRENTIIVLGNDEVKQKIFTLLDQLDVRAPQVMLSTVIGEYTLNNDSNFGIDYLLHYPSGPLANLLASGTSAGGLGSTGFLNGRSGAVATQFTGAPIASTLGSAIGAGSGFTAAIGAANSLDVIVNALESTGRFHITNEPSVCASNNKKAIIVSGEEIAIPSSTLSNLTNSTGGIGSTAAVQSSVEYKQVALQLEVVPLINSDREVSLDILQKLDSPSGATQNVGGSLIPTITTRYLRTNISVPNRSTIVLGGLITKTVGGSSSALPFLGRIPILGYLFGNKTKQSDRSELIVLIRPVVMNNPVEMDEESHTQRNKLLMEPDVDSTIISPHDSTQSKGVNFRYQDYQEVKQAQ